MIFYLLAHFSLFILLRAENNGRSTDNVLPDCGLDWSNSHLAGHFDRSFLDANIIYFPYSCRLMLYNAALICFSLTFFAALH